MKEETLITVKGMLGEVSAEPSKVFKKVLLMQLLSNKLEDEERELINLILSFQMEELWECPDPMFNTMPYEDFNQHIEYWFVRQTKKAFHTLPLIMQHMINYMSNPSSLGLTHRTIASLGYTHIGPHKWLSNNISVVPIQDTCNLCGGPTESVLCGSCKYLLRSHVKFRIEDFIWTITSSSMSPVPIGNYGDFTLKCGAFTATRIGKYAVSYVMTGRMVQLPLPFREYQTDI